MHKVLQAMLHPDTPTRLAAKLKISRQAASYLLQRLDKIETFQPRPPRKSRP